MQNKNKAYIIFALILGAFILLNFFSNSDKKEITSIIDNLEKNLEYDKVLPPLAVLSRLNKVKSSLHPEFFAKYVGNTNVRSLENTNAIKGSALMAARYFTEINIFKLPYIIEVKNESASTSLKITINGQDAQGVKFKELFDISMKFIKAEDKWYCLSIIASRLTPED